MLLAVGLVGCTMPEGDPETATLEGASTVGSYVPSACSTSVVLGLSQQIADEVGCMGTSLVKFSPSGGMQVSGSAVLLYMAPDARDGLAATATSSTLQINSAFRTVAQQYLLYQWYAQGRCGITAAATPGRSNHETGRAVDLGNYSSVVSRMASHGWAHDVAGDPVHFDHNASADLRGADVKAFQRLWNRNNPGDPIAEDGAYGPQTAARIAKSPAGGFAKGASCMTSTHAVAALASGSSGPLAPGASGTVTLQLTNTGDAAWPATTLLTTSPDGRVSELYDSAHWQSSSVVTALGVDVAPGAMVSIDVPVIAPQRDVATHVDEAFQLVDGSDAFGLIGFSVQVVPAGQSPTDDTSGEAPEAPDGGEQTVTGGCAAGGGGAGAGALMLAPLAMILRRRRRAAR